VGDSASPAGGLVIAVIVDTSVLYALTDRSESKHRAVRSALRRERKAVIVPQPVLPEICHLLRKRLGPDVERSFLEGLLASDWAVEPLADTDLARAVDLLRTYSDADLGFVDAGVMATAERLGVTRIYTLDRRDFGIVRPAHAERYELLP
jgi:predicted nucleic acid-binding protein